MFDDVAQTAEDLQGLEETKPKRREHPFPIPTRGLLPFVGSSRVHFLIWSMKTGATLKVNASDISESEASRTVAVLGT